MANKLDSTSLFLTQANQHAEALGGLLSVAAQEPIDADLLRRCLVSTHMLAKSASLMDLADWQTALDAFESLLEAYKEKNLPWDERIAQITSEIIEKEDVLVAGAGSGGSSSLAGVVSRDELQALAREVGELLEAVADAPSNPEPRTGSAAGKPAEIVSEPPVDREQGERQTNGYESSLQTGVSELKRHTQSLTDLLKSMSAGRLPRAADELRKRFLVVGFLGSAMERIVSSREGNPSAPLIDTLTPLRITMEDFARAASAGSDRHLDLSFSGEAHPIDARLLQPIHRILHSLVGDVFLRCGEARLSIEIVVAEKNGALHWAIRDNGQNSAADSHLDRDEYLAFYPGLREIRRVFGELHSLLWVEPAGTRGVRFAFTTPVSLQDNSFTVWGIGRGAVAVLSSQLVGVYQPEEVDLAWDSRGERVTADGKQVRVVRLGEVSAEGPSDGDRIAVIGSLEKRIAFYVDGAGRLEKGVWKKDGAAPGRGSENGTVEIGDARVPLVEAEALLQRYMATLDVASEEDVSGGVEVGVFHPSHAQAKKEKDAKAPPEYFSRQGEVDVLIVEQSESLRELLDSMLSRRGLLTATADGPETALAFLDAGRPAVIVCDFRVPSMAAKVVADRLHSQGRRIPILVTTSHRGDNAQLLVERLGVAGYISKPVNPDEVVSRVVAFVELSAGQASQNS